MPKLRINDVIFNYELEDTTDPSQLVRKQPPSIVFIAGYIGDINSWREMADFLKNKGHQVLIFDNQGIGATEDDGAALTIDRMADNIHALYSGLGLIRPILAGFALGGCIAQTIAYKYPDDVSNLILVSSVLKFSAEAQRYCEQLCTCRENGSELAFRTAAELIYDTCFAIAFKKMNPKQAFIDSFLPFLKVAQTKMGQRRQVEALKAFDSSVWANKISVPTLIINASEDKYAPTNDGEMLAKTIRAGGTQVKFHILEDCGHAVLMEQREALEKAFETFFIDTLVDK